MAYVMSRLGEGNKGPSPQHWELLKHSFRYLVGTADLGICIGGNGITSQNIGLHAYADASFADRELMRHSTGAHIVFAAGALVLWKTKRQTIVALSSTEAEFINLTPTGMALN